MANIKKRVKKRLPLAIIFLILVIGIAVLMYPVLSNWISVYTSKVEISSYDKTVKELDNSQIENLWQDAHDYNTALANRNGDELSALDYNKQLSVNEVMGYIDIPKINVYLPIYHGTSEEVLQKGIGHIDTTSLPVGGSSTHSVLSGHTGLPSAELFTDIDQLEVNDVFYIHVLGEVLAYKVDQIKIVLPEEDDDIQIVQGEDYVTLLTCTPYGINDHRLLVRGTRIPYDVEQEDIIQNQPSASQSEEQMIPVETILWCGIIILVLFVIIVILLILFLPGRKKRRKNKNP